MPPKSLNRQKQIDLHETYLADLICPPSARLKTVSVLPAPTVRRREDIRPVLRRAFWLQRFPRPVMRNLFGTFSRSLVWRLGAIVAVVAVAAFVKAFA